MTTAITLPHPDWRIEPGDPSVGIFGDDIVHEACPNEYDQGTRDGYVSGTRVGEGANRVIRETHLVHCYDCGINTLMMFEHADPDLPDDDDTSEKER